MNWWLLGMVFDVFHRMLLGLIVAVLAVFGAVCLQASPAEPGSPADMMFFHGTVTRVDSKHITVSRNLVGHPPESHIFLTNRGTRMNRGLEVRANVTVRYQKQAEGDVALYVQVHASSNRLRFANPEEEANGIQSGESSEP